MSVSINTYNKNYYYDLLNNENLTTAASRTERNSEEKNTDMVQFSQVALQYFNQGTTSDDEDLYTDTYRISSVESPLISVEMRSLLSNIQSNLQSIDAETTEDNAINSVEELLTDTDISTATDKEILSIFSQVLQSFQPEFDETTSDDKIGKGGPPPQLKAMNGLVPPFVLGLDDTETVENLSAKDNEFTIDDLRTILSEIQSQLSTIDLEDESSTDANYTLTSIQELLSNFDVTSASDDEVTTLFDEWTNFVEQSQQEQQQLV